VVAWCGGVAAWRGGAAAADFAREKVVCEMKRNKPFRVFDFFKEIRD